MEATRGTYLCWADEQNSEAADWLEATADNDIGTVRIGLRLDCMVGHD